jgi:hypothetical protein
VVGSSYGLIFSGRAFIIISTSRIFIPSVRDQAPASVDLTRTVVPALMRQGMRETKVLKYYYYETVGTRTIFGTRWPIVAFASADHGQYRSGLLCNGVTERVKQHRTLREAVIRAKGLAPP